MQRERRAGDEPERDRVGGGQRELLEHGFGRGQVDRMPESYGRCDRALLVDRDRGVGRCQIGTFGQWAVEQEEASLVVDDAEGGDRRAERPRAEIGDRLSDGIRGLRLGEPLRQTRQPVSQIGCVLRLVGSCGGVVEHDAQADLALDGTGQRRDHLDVFDGPVARRGVDDAERPQHVAVGRAQRVARPGEHSHLLDRRVGARQRVESGVADHERLVGVDHVLAERLFHEVLTITRVGGVDPDAALPERASLVDDRDECVRRLEQVPRQPGKSVERLVGPGVEQTGAAYRRQSMLVEHRGNAGR